MDNMEGHYSDVPKWFCRFCDRPFPYARSLKQHNQSKHWPCDICHEALLNENNLNQHKRTHLPKNIPCPFDGCICAVSSQADLILHLESGTCPSGMLRNHIRNLIARFDQDGLFIDTSMLVERPDGTRVPRKPRHVVATEASWNGSRYECAVCHHTYPRLDHLQQHVASAAHDERIFRCPRGEDGCGEHFKTFSALAQHLEAGTCGVRSLEGKIAGIVGRLRWHAAFIRRVMSRN